MNNVIKRDGREVPFDVNKIRLAITKAYKDLPEEKRHLNTPLSLEQIIQLWTDTVVEKCAAIPHAIHVEEIQDIVENPA